MNGFSTFGFLLYIENTDVQCHAEKFSMRKHSRNYK